MRNGEPVTRRPEDTAAEYAILEDFRKTFVPLNSAKDFLMLSAQYARRKVLSHGTEEIDYFYVDGRIYVSINFLEVLRQIEDREP